MQLGKHPTSKKLHDTPMLFIHGAWHGAWCWEEYFVPYFNERGFDVYTLSLSGHDVKMRLREFNKLGIKDYIKDLSDAVDKLGKNIIMVGHSMGGYVLQKYLEKYSCKAAILIAPVPHTGVLKSTWKYFMRFPVSVISSLATLDMYKVVDTTEKVHWAFFPKEMDQKLVEKFGKKVSGESMKAYLSMLFAKIKVNFHKKRPLLILGATDDNIFSIKQIQATADCYSAEMKEFDAMGHNMMLSPKWKSAATYIKTWLENKNIIKPNLNLVL